MKVLREKLDAASAQDGIHYMLTIAAPSSGYLLRGMETFDVTQYLDYVNIMSYDLHGAWNDHVGHNAALFDTGKDSELAAFTGGENGLWGKAPLPNQSECAPGTGEGEKNNCGYGAIGIDNMWHDLDPQGKEMGAGSNPMWHAKNLEHGVFGSYAAAYGLDPANDPDDKLVGTYSRNYDSVAVAPWLWNAEKSVFLSTEDKASVSVKADYIIDKEIGGIMFWELAGDYSCYLLATIDATEKACASGNGEYHMGNTMTKAIYEKFKSVSVGGFKVGDQNYPINPKITFTNNTGVDLPGGTEFQFDIPTSAPDNGKLLLLAIQKRITLAVLKVSCIAFYLPVKAMSWIWFTTYQFLDQLTMR